MSVFTRVDTAQLNDFLRRYEVGVAESLQPIAAGVTNTNYRLDTDQGEFILTLYEHMDDEDLEYILGLQQHLAARTVLCATPVPDRRGALYSTLNQRPAAVIRRLRGEIVSQLEVRHCRAAGAELARFHLAGLDFRGHRPNPRGIDWILAVRDMLEDEFQDADRQLVEQVLDGYRQIDLAALPRGAIHGDLFHDNALFQNGELGGMFDFDYACDDSFIFDLAVLINDWCIDTDLTLIPRRVDAVLESYGGIRPMSDLELRSLPMMMCFTALRFWLSRLHDRTFPLSGELTFVKSPEEYRDITALRLQLPEDSFTNTKA